ncbi:MAG: MFS transporter [Anaerolineae bacterium]|jgi:DHA3 family macrolide efflux protein-like MFS transporter
MMVESASMQDQDGEMKGWRLPFFSIWTGQAFSLVGSQLVQFALVWWLTETTGSATVLAMATLVAILPGVILGPFAGTLVDRWNRQVVMIAADGFVALVTAWLAYLFWTGSATMWHVYAAMLARALGGAFHWPSMQASTSLMVPKKHLSRVAGLNQTMRGALSIVAPPLGALLLGLLPMQEIMAIDLATAALAIGPLLFVSIPQPEKTAGAAQKSSVWSDFRSGLRYVWGWPGLMIILVMAMVINFVVNPAFSLMPLGGLLLSVWGGFRRRIYTSMMGLVLGGMSIMVLGLVPGNLFWLALVALLVAGFMNPLINGPLFAILQGTVAPEMQGRVFTLVQSLAGAMMPLSLAVAGPVSDAIGVQIWYVFGGAVFALVGVLTFFVPAVARIEDGRSEVGESQPFPDVKEAALAGE